jgi:hypothetical protein
MPVKLALAGGALLALALVLASAEARAQTKAQCADSYVEAQRLRRLGKLHDSRERLRVCMAEACPEFERVDCGKWLGEIDASMPSAVFRVVDGSANVQNARIEVDGAPVANRVDGRAVEVDPGAHGVRVVLPDGAEKSEQFVVVEGEKNHLVDLRFDRGRPPEKRDARPPEMASERPVPFLVYPLAGLGIAALGTFTGFAIASSSERSALADRCAPVCEASDVSGVRTLQIVADVSLVVAAVSLAAAGVVYLTRPTRPVPLPANAAAR